MTFGEYIKELRITQGKTLRKFCLENNFETLLISKMERNKIIVEDKKLLREVAKALGIKVRSKEWKEFFEMVKTQEIVETSVSAMPPFVFKKGKGGRMIRLTEQELMELWSDIKKL